MPRTWDNRWQHVGHQTKQGGQGRVFVVSNSTLDDAPQYALKELINPKRKARFTQEIEAIQTLPPHPNVISIVDSGIDAQQDAYYYVMELANSTLDQYLAAIAYEFELSIDCFIQVLEGVKHVHKHKIIHRDLKPANILMFDHVIPKIADFGLSLMADCEERMTPTSEPVGPRYYMPPELEDGRNLDVDSRADIYSLGKLLYFILSKGVVFSRERYNSERYNLEKRFGDARFGLFRSIFERSICEMPHSRFRSIEQFQAELSGTLDRFRSHPLSELDNKIGLSHLLSAPESLFSAETSEEGVAAGIRYIRSHDIQLTSRWIELGISNATSNTAKYDLVALIEKGIDRFTVAEKLRLVGCLAANEEMAGALLSSLHRDIPLKLLVPTIDKLDANEFNAMISHVGLFVHNYTELLPLVLKRLDDLSVKTATLVLISTAKSRMPEKYEFFERLFFEYDRSKDHDELYMYEAILSGYLGSMPRDRIQEMHKLFNSITDENRAPLIRALAHASQVNRQLINLIDKNAVQDRLVPYFAGWFS